jgi:hypothetical protein
MLHSLLYKPDTKIPNVLLAGLLLVSSDSPHPLTGRLLSKIARFKVSLLLSLASCCSFEDAYQSQPWPTITASAAARFQVPTRRITIMIISILHWPLDRGLIVSLLHLSFPNTADQLIRHPRSLSMTTSTKLPIFGTALLTHPSSRRSRIIHS